MVDGEEVEETRGSEGAGGGDPGDGSVGGVGWERSEVRVMAGGGGVEDGDTIVGDKPIVGMNPDGAGEAGELVMEGKGRVEDGGGAIGGAVGRVEKGWEASRTEVRGNGQKEKGRNSEGCPGEGIGEGNLVSSKMT